MTSLIAEDLLLLLLDDESGDPLVDGTRLPRVLAGAVLLELALDGYVTPADQGEDVKRGRL
ncbi:GPP34 family phosphoprotein, partial [Prescottella equi]